MKILLYLAAGFLFLIIYVRFLESVSLFLPSRRIVATPADAGMDFEDIYFSTEDHVRINGWLIKAKQNSEQTTTFLYFHGNAGNISDRVEKIAEFHDLGLNVFIIDYRGYGRSQGKPTEVGLYKDATAAYEYLLSRKDIASAKIVAYGASLGGVPAVDLAARRPVAALIADSTFTSAVDMGRTIAPFIPSFLITIKLDSLSKIGKVKAPQLFIHSPEDDTVPFQFGQKLYQAAPGPKEFLQISGSHNDGYATSKDVFFGGVKSFLLKYNLL